MYIIYEGVAEWTDNMVGSDSVSKIPSENQFLMMCNVPYIF